MQESQELPLQQLAVYAAHNSIKGSSFKRNALLKPLDIILEELDRCKNPDDKKELAVIRAGTKELIFDHLARIAKEEYKPGDTPHRLKTSGFCHPYVSGCRRHGD